MTDTPTDPRCCDRHHLTPVRSTLDMTLAMYKPGARGCAVDLPVQDDQDIWEFKS